MTSVVTVNFTASNPAGLTKPLTRAHHSDFMGRMTPNPKHKIHEITRDLPKQYQEMLTAQDCHFVTFLGFRVVRHLTIQGCEDHRKHIAQLNPRE
jgi:hypothetical protein